MSTTERTEHTVPYEVQYSLSEFFSPILLNIYFFPRYTNPHEILSKVKLGEKKDHRRM